MDIKVVVLGQEGVGKSCLVDRFISQRFDEYQKNTIGAAFAAKKVSSSLGYVSLGIWDTAGVEVSHQVL